ncbi:hypothetical protein GCM10010244_85810 [Streptomyces coeruleorubidus]|nr:hypothetical protein GCM10010244_85810 [Streptomyces bellus]
MDKSNRIRTGPQHARSVSPVVGGRGAGFRQGDGARRVTWQGRSSLRRGDAAWAGCTYGGQVVSVLVAGESVGWQATVVVQQSG